MPRLGLEKQDATNDFIETRLLALALSLQFGVAESVEEAEAEEIDGGGIFSISVVRPHPQDQHFFPR